MLKEARTDHSIVLYWVIACCNWIGGGAFDCPDPKTASGVKTYSLKKPWRMSSSRYLRRLQQRMILCPLPSSRSSTFLLGDARVVLDGSKTPDLELVLNGVEDFVDGEPKTE